MPANNTTELTTVAANQFVRYILAPKLSFLELMILGIINLHVSVPNIKYILTPWQIIQQVKLENVAIANALQLKSIWRLDSPFPL